MKRIRDTIPLLIVLVVIFVLAYPVAFWMGYPKAKNNLEDKNRWSQSTIEAQPPKNISDQTSLRFDGTVDADSGILVRDNRPLQLSYTTKDGHVTIPNAQDLITLHELDGMIDGTNQLFTSATNGADLPLYLDGILQESMIEPALEKPDGQLLAFTFTSTEGAFALRGQILRPEVDYVVEENSIILNQAPPLWLALRAEPYWARPFRIYGDYAWADDNTVVLREPPIMGSSILIAEDVARWAERLQGAIDGQNKVFSFASIDIVPGDEAREIYLDDLLLDPESRRPRENTDGERTEFTFNNSIGIITLDGEILEPISDYVQDGNVIKLSESPLRLSKLRQSDYLVTNAENGEILLPQAPTDGSVLWAFRYTIYGEPQCGSTIPECFISLPQHPMPLPHWIISGIPNFLSRYDFQSARNPLQAAIYSAKGTLVALLFGGFIGMLLASLFVLIKPLERAFLPWVIASQTVPIIALVPVLVLILANFGIPIQTSILPSALIGGYLSFFPITIGATKGLRSVDPMALDLMTSYAASKNQVFLKVRIFAALPFLFASFKIGAAASLVGALIAETETSNAKGLGYTILGQVQAGNVADLWVLFIISSLMGILFVSAISWLENLLAPWVRKV
jgi:NitT/TauT family transport system permease protein